MHLLSDRKCCRFYLKFSRVHPGDDLSGASEHLGASSPGRPEGEQARHWTKGVSSPYLPSRADDGPRRRRRQRAERAVRDKRRAVAGSVPHALGGLLARLRNYLLAGIIVTAPVSITFFIIWQIVDFFDEWASALIPAPYNPERYLPFSLPGLGFLIMLGLLTLIGWFTAGYIGRTLMRMGERVLHRMPVVRSIYGTLKQIFETILAQSSRSFREVVLIEYPRRGLWAIAFVTGPTRGEIQDMSDEELINVFLPTTPNPTSGFLLFVPKRDVVHLSMSIEEGMKLVISGGIVTPPAPGALEPAAQPAGVRASARAEELSGGIVTE